MKLFPAIDLRDGRVVRLFKGDFGAETHYGDDPVGVAKNFEAAGAPWIHVVDLDAARTGKPKNRVVVGAIAASVNIPVQSGGGVRDLDSAESLLDSGVQRIVLGTAAIEQPGLVEQLAMKYPGRIAVGLDARNGSVATRGWESGGGAGVTELVSRFSNSGVAAFVVTDINRDGTLEGPDTEGLAEVLAITDADVVASGGVGSITDLRLLAELKIDGRQLAGAIVGKAIYEKKFSVADAVKACELQ